jgi:zinc-binding in reverse transcriptase
MAAYYENGRLIGNSRSYQHINSYPTWRLQVPDRVRIFIWLVQHNSILTQENLSKRGWPHLDIRIMCKRTIVETTDHLLLHRRLARAIWAPRTPQPGLTAYDYWLQMRKRLPSPAARRDWDCLYGNILAIMERQK